MNRPVGSGVYGLQTPILDLCDPDPDRVVTLTPGPTAPVHFPRSEFRSSVTVEGLVVWDLVLRGPSPYPLRSTHSRDHRRPSELRISEDRARGKERKDHIGVRAG